MAGNKTLALIKPKAVGNGHAGAILHIINASGFSIKGLKMLKMSKKMAEEFYAEHKNKDFYKSLIEYITSSPVIAAYICKDNAVENFRELIGATDPKIAAPETIRAKFGTSAQMNAIHGSDSDKNALREISIVFNEDEIF